MRGVASPMDGYASDGYQLPSGVEAHSSTFSDLMIMGGDYYSPTYLPTPPEHGHQKMDMGCLSEHTPHKILGKRKSCYSSRDGDDDDKSLRSNGTSNGDKKQNHSEIEKRRRDKMNTYITELATMIPMCHANPRKLDKLTVLRMAVQHLRSVRGAVHSYVEGHYKPSFLSDEEMKNVILQAAEGFLFVVGCDRGRILFVSESVSSVLQYSQGELVGQSVFDILHPKDVTKVKEQLCSADLNPRERFIDSKTMLPVKTDVPVGASRLSTGSRRSFLCRFRMKKCEEMKDDPESSLSQANHRHHRHRNKQLPDKRYCVVQCTGYMKSWAPAKLDEGDSESDGCNLSCLVAIGRQVGGGALVPPQLPGPPPRPVHYVSRHTIDGAFTFIDQRAAASLGFLPQEMIGTSMYEYFHPEDVRHLSDCHRAALRSLDISRTPSYRFRVKDGGFIRVESEWRQFSNPWTNEIEYIIAKNVAYLSDVENSDTMSSYGTYDRKCENLPRVVATHEASHIGKQIAKEVLRRTAAISSDESSSPPDHLPTTTLTNLESSGASMLEDGGAGRNSMMQRLRLNVVSPEMYLDVRNNLPLSSTAQGSSEADMLEVMGEEVAPAAASTEGNDEAAMAVIMSLLEADAGLGGPVDFSGLPWPLP